MEKRVEDALRNDCSAVQAFAFARFKERVVAEPPTWAPKVPEEEREPPTAREVVAIEDRAFVPLP